MRRSTIVNNWSYAVTRVGDTCTVVLAGDVDVAVHEELRDVLLAEVNWPGNVPVEIDMRNVESLDSSGMGAIAVAYSVAQTAGRSLTLVHVHGRALRVLEIAGMMPLLSGRTEPPRATRSA